MNTIGFSLTKAKMLFLILILFLSATNIKSQVWETLADHPDPPNIPVMAAANGKLYVLSGVQTTNAPTYEYDPLTNTWTKKSDIPQGCYWASAVSLNNKIYVMGGGHPYPGQTYNQIYDPASDAWTSGADLLTPRMYHSAAVTNSKIYLLGGQNGDGTSEWYFEEYDPDSNTWKTKTQLPNNGAWYCGAVGYEGKIYRIAGGGSSISLVRDNFDVYDVATNNWTEKPKFHKGLHAPFAVVYNEKIWLIGGYNNNKYTDSIWLYDITNESWGPSWITMPEPRSYHRAAVIDTCIYVFGGTNYSGDLKNSLIRLCPNSLSNNESGGKHDLKIRAYPNPGDGILNLEFNEAISEGISAEIWNSIGKLVYEKTFRLNDQKSIQLNVKDKCNSGIYYMKVSLRGNIITNKFIIR